MSAHETHRYWTAREIAALNAMKADGCSLSLICAELERTPRSVKSMLYSKRKAGPREVYTTPYYDGPPIGRDPYQERLNLNAVEGSAKLRDAIRRLAA